MTERQGGDDEERSGPRQLAEEAAYSRTGCLLLRLPGRDAGARLRCRRSETGQNVPSPLPCVMVSRTGWLPRLSSAATNDRPGDCPNREATTVAVPADVATGVCVLPVQPSWSRPGMELSRSGTIARAPQAACTTRARGCPYAGKRPAARPRGDRRSPCGPFDAGLVPWPTLGSRRGGFTGSRSGPPGRGTGAVRVRQARRPCAATRRRGSGMR